MTLLSNIQRQAAPSPLRISLAGFGTVGQALAERLGAEPRFEIVSVLVRDPGKHRRVHPPCPITADRARFAAVGADILVDALSCDDTGTFLSRQALGHGLHVVSASKRVISRHHDELHSRARAAGLRLGFSAAVGGATPVLEAIAAVRPGSGVREVAAILNGTVNLILDRMSEGASFDAALAEAKAGGFAEEDCSCDLSGADAAAKLRLIAGEAFGVDPASLAVATEPLDEPVIARIQADGRRWVQLATIRRSAGRVEAEVALRPLADLPGFPNPRGEWNCARISLESGAELLCSGPGAGGAATAEAILSDLHRIEGAECAATGLAPGSRPLKTAWL